MVGFFLPYFCHCCCCFFTIVVVVAFSYKSAAKRLKNAQKCVRTCRQTIFQLSLSKACEELVSAWVTPFAVTPLPAPRQMTLSSSCCMQLITLSTRRKEREKTRRWLWQQKNRKIKPTGAGELNFGQVNRLTASQLGEPFSQLREQAVWVWQEGRVKAVKYEACAAASSRHLKHLSDSSCHFILRTF